jgi:hypothetical protein
MSDNSVAILGRLRGTVVVVQHPTNPLTAANTSSAIGSLERLNQLVTDAFVVHYHAERNHLNDEASNLGEHPRSSWPPSGVGPFPRNQFALPSKNRVGRNERGQLSQCGASEPLPQHRETSPLRIV